MALSLLGQAIPVFWLGIVLQLFFSVELGWLPPFGSDGLISLILPAATLTPWVLARLVRLVRSSMLDVLSENYIRTARGKGLHERAVVYKHALRNAGLPIVTMVGIMFGYLLGGAVLTETIFSWPGVGLLVVESIFRRDFPVVQAVVFLVAIGVILINLGVDMLYAVLDPQIRYS
jgi:ABC-type dipeptide/oligopeptide/nickel transport system permease component